MKIGWCVFLPPFRHPLGQLIYDPHQIVNGFFEEIEYWGSIQSPSPC
jgi:hypothetical protein